MKTALAIALLVAAAVLAVWCFMSWSDSRTGSCGICGVRVPFGVTIYGLEQLGWRWRRPHAESCMPERSLEPVCPNCAPFDPSASTLG